MFAKAYMGQKRWAKPTIVFTVVATKFWVPHISLVFREMWDTANPTTNP
jgi:hypothetical protein